VCVTHPNRPKALFKGLFLSFPSSKAWELEYNDIMYLTHSFLFATLLWSSFCFGQDERDFREILLHKKGKKDVDYKEVKDLKFKTRSPKYYLDITHDNINESFHVSKVDGQDWLTIFDSKGEQVFRHKFNAHGPWSRLFRVQKRELSKKTQTLILHFFEGRTNYLELKGTARLYFLTIDKNNLQTIAVSKGPAFWYEYRDRQKNYNRRTYKLSLYDYDEDGVREITVKHKRMSRVYKYVGGKFIRPNHLKQNEEIL
jgi:hypothetical protein